MTRVFDPRKERIEDYIERQLRERLGEEARAALEEREHEREADFVQQSDGESHP